MCFDTAVLCQDDISTVSATCTINAGSSLVPSAKCLSPRLQQCLAAFDKLRQAFRTVEAKFIVVSVEIIDCLHHQENGITSGHEESIEGLAHAYFAVARDSWSACGAWTLSEQRI